MIQSKVIDLFEFYNKHKPFTQLISNVDKRRHFQYELQSYFDLFAGKVTIHSHRDSKTTRVHNTFQFTFFRVPINQRGKMINLRGRMVMMICTGRERFTHYLEVYPIDLNEEQIREFINTNALNNYSYFTDTMVEVN